MAQRIDVQYIRYYTDGSAARQLEPKVPQKSRPLPKVKKQPKRTVYIQPVAVAGVLLSVAMLIMMISGFAELRSAQRQEEAMQKYVYDLTVANSEARAEYEADLDIEEIERSALALGMIPQEQAKQITITIPTVEAAEETSIWDNITLFFRDLFA